MRNQAAMSAQRPHRTTESIRCVVLESGSLLLTDTDAENFDHTIVIAQMQDEPPAAFAERTLERVAGLERSGRRFEAATILTGNHHDGPAQAARRRIVLSLAAHLLPTPGAKLTLRAARDTAPDDRAELLDLAADVMGYRGSDDDGSIEPVGVRLCFDEGGAEPRRRSGTFHAIPDNPVSASDATTGPASEHAH